MHHNRSGTRKHHMYSLRVGTACLPCLCMWSGMMHNMKPPACSTACGVRVMRTRVAHAHTYTHATPRCTTCTTTRTHTRNPLYAMASTRCTTCILFTSHFMLHYMHFFMLFTCFLLAFGYRLRGHAHLSSPHHQHVSRASRVSCWVHVGSEPPRGHSMSHYHVQAHDV